MISYKKRCKSNTLLLFGWKGVFYMEFIDYAKMYRKMLEGKIAQLEESIKGFPAGCLHIY